MPREGYDRRLLGQIRAVLATEPGLFSDAPAGSTVVRPTCVATLKARPGDQYSSLEIHALTLMAINWFLTAAHIYLTEGRPSLLTCYDEVGLSLRAGQRIEPRLTLGGGRTAQATWRSIQPLRGRAACRQAITRSLALLVPSQAPTGQDLDMTMPLRLSSSMRGWSFG